MPSSRTDALWTVYSSRSAHPARMAYDCLRAAGPYRDAIPLFSKHHTSNVLEERLDALLREAELIDRWIESIFTPSQINMTNLARRRLAGERDPKPRVLISAARTSKGNLSVSALPIISENTGDADIHPDTRLDWQIGWHERPMFEILFMRGTDDYFQICTGDAVDRSVKETLCAFVLRSFEYLTEELRKIAEVEIDCAVEWCVEDGTRHLLLTTPESRRERETARQQAEKAEAERKRLEDDAAWLRGLSHDPTRIEATIDAALAAGAVKKELIAFLVGIGIHVRYETLDDLIDRLRSSLDRNVPGWRETGAEPLVVLGPKTKPPPPTSDTTGRQGFDRTVALINEHRVTNGLEPVPAGRVPRTVQHLRRLAKQSGYVLGKDA